MYRVLAVLALLVAMINGGREHARGRGLVPSDPGVVHVLDGGGGGPPPPDAHSLDGGGGGPPPTPAP